jgi:hypothetical protein
MVSAVMYTEYLTALFCSIIQNSILSVLRQVQSLFGSTFYHRERSSVSFSNFQSPLFSLRSSSSCRRIFPRLTITSILPSVSPSITHFWRQFLPKMWPIQLPFLLFIACGIFSSYLALCNYFSFLHDLADLLQPSLAPHSKTLHVFLI